MRRLVFTALIVIGASTAAFAQADRPLSALAIKVACAPPPTLDPPPADALRIIGSQDPIPRGLYGNRDLLVIGGGTSKGVQLGQQFFIRRPIVGYGSKTARGTLTLGWLRVVAVNDTTAIALVNQACAGILRGDYLETFVEPVVSAEMERDETPGQPDFTTLGHIVIGNEDRGIVGAGDFVLIDWGQAQGLTPGSRFAIYRDPGASGSMYRPAGNAALPLASVGEGVVISTSNKMALTRITRARDPISKGDYIAVRR
jgi:hypothetical protein